MFTLVKVKGDSMSPCYRHNDFLLLKKIHRRKLKAGDDIVCQHPFYKTIFKRISYISDDKIYLTGLNSASTSNSNLGYISGRQVVGKVIWHIKQANL